MVERAAAISSGTFRRRRTDWPRRSRLVAPATGPAANVRPEFPRVVLAHPPGLARRCLRARFVVFRLERSRVRVVAGSHRGAVFRGDIRLDAAGVSDPPL